MFASTPTGSARVNSAANRHEFRYQAVISQSIDLLANREDTDIKLLAA